MTRGRRGRNSYARAAPARRRPARARAPPLVAVAGSHSHTPLAEPTMAVLYPVSWALLAAAAAPPPLPSLGLDAGAVSISGISSGADFAVYFSIAHSSSVVGAGVFAGNASAFCSMILILAL